MSIGQRLKEARKARSMSQDMLAEKIGASRGVIINIEYDKISNPQPMVIHAICNTLSISEEWLRTGKGSMLDNSVPSLLTRLSLLCEEEHLTPREQALISAFFSLSPQDRAAVMRYVDTITRELNNLEPKP